MTSAALLTGGPGDIASCYAEAKLGRDAWRWQSTNPAGYPG